MWRQQDEAETLRKGSAAAKRGDSAAAPCLRCCRVHLPMPNNTNLKLLRGPMDFSVSYVLPAAINYSHFQDVKSCDSTKETVRDKLTSAVIYLFIIYYLASGTISNPPSHQLYIDEFYHLCF